MIQGCAVFLRNRMMKTISRFFTALVVATFFASTADADTKSYTGMGNYTTNDLTMKLGNGKTVFSARTEGAATISTEPPELLAVKCLGLGLMNEDKHFGSRVFCTFRRNAEDSFDILGEGNEKGGEGQIIGGSGIWKGAIGTVTFERIATTDNGGSFSYKMTMDTP